MIESKFADRLGRSEVGLGFRDPKNADGLAARDTEAARCVDDGLDAVLEAPVGLNAGAVTLGRNSDARTFMLNLEDEVVDVGVCMLDL